VYLRLVPSGTSVSPSAAFRNLKANSCFSGTYILASDATAIERKLRTTSEARGGLDWLVFVWPTIITTTR